MTDIPKKRVCVSCGDDITRALKFYPFGYESGPFCYKCNETVKEEKRKIRRELYENTVDQILTMHRMKIRVSEIARVMGMSAKDVYEIITTARGE